MQSTRIAGIACLFGLATVHFLAGCFPEHSFVVPGMQLHVTDTSGRPIAGAKVLAVARQYPYTEVRARILTSTDTHGFARLPERRRWVMQAPLLMHGVVHHNIDVCVVASGLGPFSTELETRSVDAEIPLEVRLEPRKRDDVCVADPTHGISIISEARLPRGSAPVDILTP